MDVLRKLDYLTVFKSIDNCFGFELTVEDGNPVLRFNIKVSSYLNMWQIVVCKVVFFWNDSSEKFGFTIKSCNAVAEVVIPLHQKQTIVIEVYENKVVGSNLNGFIITETRSHGNCMKKMIALDKTRFMKNEEVDKAKVMSKFFSRANELMFEVESTLTFGGFED
ncbi:hypothetical protein [Carp edema virus]|nr:hypothetical protein [Carp edema virus]